ncbi:polymer-forming cytoskeletal protein [Halovivax sp.]|uniref:polymer-forming cytoskeletal protein n=1 Tax=Halovivax sp. TaxID=1935978 RepID=UPI0025C21336|nr:polymer-forming cytoskeletal protein [Halovivax sp.]
MRSPHAHRFAVWILVVTLALALVPGVAIAETGVGGTVVVEEGETVSEVSAVAGSVIVEGTVTGDVSALAGNVHVDGTVEGDLDVAAGNVRIAGTVDGDVSTGAGNVHVEDGGEVGGTFDVGAANVLIDGSIDGDATVGADTIRLGDDAALGGSLTYDGSLEGNTDAVAGDVTHDSTLGVGLVGDVQPLASWLFAVYAFALNLLLGALLLALFPRFSTAVGDRVAADPVRTGAIGLAVLVGVPILLIALAITVIGIPVTIVGALAFAIVVWIALVYGRFAVGSWLLSYADVENRWLALFVGLLVGSVLAQLPWVGGLANFVILLLGLGSLSAGLYVHRKRSRPVPTAAGPGEPASD